MFGGDGADQIFGNSGNDTADGDRGNDVAFLCEGNDLFVWDLGDGSDRVEGEAGFDTMLVNGSGADEVFHASANGPRLRFIRDVGNIVMDVDGGERVDVEVLGGADTVTLNDLTGTAVQELRIDLEAVKGGGAADDKVDRVILNGTNQSDFVDVLASPGQLFVLGFPTFVSVQRAAPADELTLNARGGNDRVSGSGVPAGLMTFTIDGGSGNDNLSGTNGVDRLIGGAGDDVLLNGEVVFDE
jgi:Ca2+-binding RTX toxin-like protein